MKKIIIILAALLLPIIGLTGSVLTISSHRDTSIEISEGEDSGPSHETRSSYADTDVLIAGTEFSCVEGEPCTINLFASGGTGGYYWSVQSGNLPSGLTLATDGSISGEPESGGTYSFTVSVSDSGGNTDNRTINIEITEGEEEDGASPILWLSIVIIIMIMTILMVMFLMLKKKTMIEAKRRETEAAIKEATVDESEEETKDMVEEVKEDTIEEEVDFKEQEPESVEYETEPAMVILEPESVEHEAEPAMVILEPESVEHEAPPTMTIMEPGPGTPARKGSMRRRRMAPRNEKRERGDLTPISRNGQSQLKEASRMDKHIEEKMNLLMGRRKVKRGAVIGFICLFVVILFLALTIRRVPAGKVGVYTNGMSIGTQKDSGWVIKNPFSTMEIYRHNTQSIEETVIVTSIEEDGSGYNVPMDFQVVYHLEKSKVGNLIVDNPDYKDTKIVQRLRSKVRQIIADEKYSGIEINSNKSVIQGLVEKDLRVYLLTEFIIVEEVALRNVELPSNVQQASRERAQSEIEIATATNDYKRELEIVKQKLANADADYNVTVIAANAEKQKLIIEASGRAEAIAEIQNQFNLTDANISSQVYLQYLFMSALSDPDTNVDFFIVPVGEDGMPVILDLSKYKGEENS